VTIRSFLVTYPEIFGALPSCGMQGAHLQAEVSTARMVGIVGGGFSGADKTQPASSIWSQVVGTAEGDPVAVVTAATGATVGQVSMTFAGGTTDQMTPVAGWVALAAPVPAALSYGQTAGTLTERDSAGKVIGSQSVRLGVQSGNLAPSCTSGCPRMQPQTGAASGAGSSSTFTCLPAPCGTNPRALVPPKGEGAASGSPSSSTAVNPGGPLAASTGDAISTYACAMPAPAPGASNGASAGARSAP
jgi:hypothetical protein